jgi:hypothetical protein
MIQKLLAQGDHSGQSSVSRLGKILGSSYQTRITGLSDTVPAAAGRRRITSTAHSSPTARTLPLERNGLRLEATIIVQAPTTRIGFSFCVERFAIIEPTRQVQAPTQAARNRLVLDLGSAV